MGLDHPYKPFSWVPQPPAPDFISNRNTYSQPLFTTQHLRSCPHTLSVSLLASGPLILSHSGAPSPLQNCSDKKAQTASKGPEAVAPFLSPLPWTLAGLQPC